MSYATQLTTYRVGYFSQKAFNCLNTVCVYEGETGEEVIICEVVDEGKKPTILHDDLVCVGKVGRFLRSIPGGRMKVTPIYENLDYEKLDLEDYRALFHETYFKS